LLQGFITRFRRSKNVQRTSGRFFTKKWGWGILVPWNWFAKLKNLKFSIVIIVLQAFLLVNAPLFIQSADAQGYGFLLITYMVLLVGFEAFVGEGVFKSESIGFGLLWFGVGLVGSSIVFSGGEFLSGIQSNMQAFQFTRSAPVILLITQSVVVASSEEQIFRNYLPQSVGIVPAQIGFAVFHAAAYSLAFGNIIIALAAGFIFYFIAHYTSLWCSVGIHVGWNLYSLGVLSIIIGGA